MWGSYVGILGALFYSSDISICNTLGMNGCFLDYNNMFNTGFPYWIVIVAGFLVGYGIHALIRRLRK